MAMTVGILGGSFNPPHRGHLALARTVLDQGLVDEVVLIPAASPPHKPPLQADAPTRLAMSRLLAQEDARLAVSDIELHRAGPSFTVDTVTELRARRPEAAFRLVIGSDMAKSFATWRGYKQLLAAAPPLVAERPDDAFANLGAAEYPGMDVAEAGIMEKGRFSMSPVMISSTMIRELLANHADDAELLPYLTEPVLRFIRDNGLYI